MEFVRQIVEGSELANIIPLPLSFRSGKVEVIILPIAQKALPSEYSGKNIDEMLKGSITQSLIGAIPISDISPEEIRGERLRKYESID
ncbi:MAG: hypothetical protein FWH52_05570 [Synergistaceae bacterium]|nr:hypothetical protein [Synergistaceae bacterium]